MEGLKFRTWRKGISYIFSKPYLLAEYTVLSFLPEDEELKGINCFGYDDFEFDCIEQFTGLKDKNGKEIYEGDIIKYQDRDYSEVFGQGDVYYDGDDCMFKIRCNYVILFFMNLLGEELEVIGNIHDKEDK